MNFDALDEIIRKNTDLNICPICGTPFRQYHRRQKTCGTEECKRQWHNSYLRKRRVRLMTEDRDAFNKEHAEAQRKYRLKKRGIKEMSEALDRMQAHWDAVLEKETRLADGGFDYGKRQMEKTLANVPKIDVSGFGKENKE